MQILLCRVICTSESLHVNINTKFAQAEKFDLFLRQMTCASSFVQVGETLHVKEYRDFAKYEPFGLFPSEKQTILSIL